MDTVEYARLERERIAAKRAAEEAEEQKRFLDRLKRRHDDTAVQSAKERYLARKKQKGDLPPADA